MHLEFRVKPINDKKDTYWTAPTRLLLQNNYRIECSRGRNNQSVFAPGTVPSRKLYLNYL